MRRSHTFVISLLFLILLSCGEGFASEKNEVDVSFVILTGSGDDQFYVGDYFYYNITLLNSGNTTINATISVAVFNSTDGLMAGAENYSIFLQPNQTTFLYQNRTALRAEKEVTVYHLDTPGTYSILLSSETPITYFLYYDEQVFRYYTGYFRYSFDVMASYLKAQNERWNEFVTKNEDYMEEVDRYIQESRMQSQETRNLAFLSMFVATFSVVMSMVNTFLSWWKLDEEKQKENRLFYWLVIILMGVFLGFIAYMFFLIS